MSNRYDVMSPRKDREGKTRWTRVGVMFPAKSGNGFAIKFEALPLPDEKGEVWVQAMEPKERDADEDRPAAKQQGRPPASYNPIPQKPAPSSGPMLDDEIPF